MRLNNEENKEIISTIFIQTVMSKTKHIHYKFSKTYICKFL
jgi:hypothetical protein